MIRWEMREDYFHIMLSEEKGVIFFSGVILSPIKSMV